MILSENKKIRTVLMAFFVSAIVVSLAYLLSQFKVAYALEGIIEQGTNSATEFIVSIASFIAPLVFLGAAFVRFGLPLDPKIKQAATGCMIGSLVVAVLCSNNAAIAKLIYETVSGWFGGTAGGGGQP